MRKQPLHILSVAGGYEVKKCIAAGGIEVIPANVLPVRSLQTCFGGDGVYPPVNSIANRSGFSGKKNVSGKAFTL